MSRNAKISRLLAGEQGEGIVSAILLLSGVLIPLLFLIALVGQVEQGRLAASQAARAAVRAAVEAPSASAAQTAAEQQLAEIADADVEVARATRTRMLREMSRTGALVLGTHFPSRPAGRVTVDGDVWRFVPE